MKPIPKKLLPDFLTVFQSDQASEFGGKFLGSQIIENVRFETKDELNPKTYQLAENAKGRIWIDAVNSKNAFEIARGSKVVINNGGSMIVKAVAPYKGLNGRIHHWEVDCG